MSYIFVGLGNPGEEYQSTRHNTGRIMLEFFRKSQNLPQWEANKKINALVSEGKVGKEKVMLVEPDTFMNKSGNALKSLVKSKKAAEKLLVIQDDLDLPVGRIKISFNRGSGGHRGIESIIRAVGTEGFIRLRVGISPETAGGKIKKPSGEKAVNDFILGKFKPADEAEFKKLGKKASEALEMLLKEGREKATGFANSL
ncbi:MAG: aminoacyl-tRNA hydrolase [Candidatus Pacebacteria bacterium]|nr:aminoacyl-tRNA hydrolase [Candidatus Paceibacterota bacterium]